MRPSASWVEPTKVTYMEAVETDDMSRREEIVEALCAYNQEDLEATWAVQKWLRSL
jgi:hypothetical protein